MLNFSLLRAEGVSCNFDVLYLRPRDKKIVIVDQKRKKNFQCTFFNFLVVKILDPILDSHEMLDPQHWLFLTMGQIWNRHTGTGMYCCNSCLQIVFRSKLCGFCSWTTGIRTPCPGGAATPSNPTSCFRLWWFRYASSTLLSARVRCYISGARLYTCLFWSADL